MILEGVKEKSTFIIKQNVFDEMALLILYALVTRHIKKVFFLCSFTQKNRLGSCGEVKNFIPAMIGYFKHDIFSRHASNLKICIINIPSVCHG